MCGRFVLSTPPERLAQAFGAELSTSVATVKVPRFNIAPTSQILGIKMDKNGDRSLEGFRWGLVPFWAKDPAIGNQTFNARAESVATKPSFREAFKSRRIVVLADGYFEWQKGPRKQRQPFYFKRADHQPMAFAGLFETWVAPVKKGLDGPEEFEIRGVESELSPKKLITCTIITTNASHELSAIHDRMPVILGKDSVSRWLDPSETDRIALESLLVAPDSGTLSMWPVGKRVGDVRNDDPGLVDVSNDQLG